MFKFPVSSARQEFGVSTAMAQYLSGSTVICLDAQMQVKLAVFPLKPECLVITVVRNRNKTFRSVKNQKRFSAQFNPIPGNVMILKATCDEKMTVYVDGYVQYAANLDTWNIQSTIVMPNGFKVIAIKCDNIWGDLGLIASVENHLGELVLLSDTTWKCSQVFEEGWQRKDYESSSENWQIATNIGKKSWSVSGQISPLASWIWTEDRVDTIYCRGGLPWTRGCGSRTVERWTVGW